MEVLYTVSRYNPTFESHETASVSEAVAFAEVGAGGLIAKHVDGKTSSAWRRQPDGWYRISLFGGRVLGKGHPDPAQHELESGQ